MAVLKLKPHVLSYLVSSPGYEDGRGDYHAGESRWEGNIPCDAVPSSGKADTADFGDGVARSYSYVVYLPAGCRHFSPGDRVRIGSCSCGWREFEVKGFHRWQHQCKMWV